LPERWRQVLWSTKVDELAPTAAGSLLGMRPNSVAALAMRARGALRIAYVREHLPPSPPRACGSALNLLARRSVMPIGRTQDAFLREHLDGCRTCGDAVELITAQIGTWIKSATWAPVSGTVRRHNTPSDARGRTSDDLAPPPLSVVNE